MRPPELDVTLRLEQLIVSRTEDSGGDEPYMWILGFKVDADTIDPSAPGGPSIGVQTFLGAPAMPWLLGTGDVEAPATLMIPPALGTRSLRLRPERIDAVGWFDGLAGIVALLWDQDALSPTTSEAGHAAFNRAFGPALSAELQTLLAGDPGYDAALNRDAAGNSLPIPADGFTLRWRVGRMSDPAGIRNAVRELTRRVKDAISGSIRSALADEADWDEVVDPDDLLGADAVAFTGRQLASAQQAISLRYTDDDADYEARGGAVGTRVRRHRLDSAETSSTKTFVQSVLVQTRVCWFPPRTYVATAYHLTTTTRFQVVPLAGGNPSQVRWFVDGAALNGASGTIPVEFGRLTAITGSPGKVLADGFPGGPGQLAWDASGLSLELTNVAGDGIWSGTVRAILGYPGDPTLTPAGNVSAPDIWDRGYELQEELSIITVEIVMDAQYAKDAAECRSTVAYIDRKRIRVELVPDIDPGDPPFEFSILVESLRTQTEVVRYSPTSPQGMAVGPDVTVGTVRILGGMRASGPLSAEEVRELQLRNLEDGPASAS